MKKILSTISVLALVVGFYSCDSGSEEADKDTNVPQDTNVEEDTAPPADLVEPDVTATDVPGEDVPTTVTGACINEADNTYLETNRDAVSAKAKECGLACMSEEDTIACSIPCIKEVHPLTDDCAGCYAGTIVCTVEKCLMQCLSDPDAPECIACQEEQGCLPTFYACTGLTAE